MNARLKKYSLTAPRQEIDDKEAWKHETIENKIHVLEVLRAMWVKMSSQKEKHGDFQGLRRVLRVVNKEDLIANKKASGRKKDQNDLDELL